MVSRKKQAIQREGTKTNLRQLREALGMTQVEFAVAIGVSPSTVGKCEQGITELSLEAGSIRKLHLLMINTLGYGVERLPDSFKAVSQEEIFA